MKTCRQRGEDDEWYALCFGKKQPLAGLGSGNVAAVLN
jgi:hypothetical protein